MWNQGLSFALNVLLVEISEKLSMYLCWSISWALLLISVFAYSGGSNNHSHNSGDQRGSAVPPADNWSSRSASGLPGWPVCTLPACTSAARIRDPAHAPGLRSSAHAHDALPSAGVHTRTTSNIPGSQWVSQSESIPSVIVTRCDNKM